MSQKALAMSHSSFLPDSSEKILQLSHLGIYNWTDRITDLLHLRNITAISVYCFFFLFEKVGDKFRCTKTAYQRMKGWLVFVTRSPATGTVFTFLVKWVSADLLRVHMWQPPVAFLTPQPHRHPSSLQGCNSDTCQVTRPERWQRPQVNTSGL